MSQDGSHSEITQMIGEQIRLPSPPAIAVRILNTVQDRECSLADLEKIISADAALTSKLLRIANSAFYSLPNEIRSIGRALSILGMNVIKNIALSFIISKDLRVDSTQFFDFDCFWRRSITAAVAAELLADLQKVKDEDIFVTAILQDIGTLILYLRKGQEYAEALQQSRDNMHKELIDLEREKYQFDHQQVGFTLLSNWSIPAVITMPIQYHHTPEAAPEAYRNTAEILMTADLVSAIYASGKTGEKVRELQARMASVFGVDFPKTIELLDDVARKSVDILRIFDLDPGMMRPYSQMLQEANEELCKLNLSYDQLILELKEAREASERIADELRQANRQLQEMASRDDLTSLYNHRYFHKIFDKELDRCKRYKHPLSLIMVDIDFFKQVNDTHGHPAGDQVLINLARAIRGAMRRNDIIARYGGEEFAVILPETSRTSLKVFAERLRRCVAGVTTTYRDSAINVSISGGGVEYCPETRMTKQELLDIADRGLCLSKKNGGNRITILDHVP